MQKMPYKTPKTERPTTDLILNFSTNPSAKFKIGQKGKLIDKNGKRFRYKIMRYNNGEGSLMIPLSYLKRRR